jgi:hypothetical protein
MMGNGRDRLGRGSDAENRLPLHRYRPAANLESDGIVHGDLPVSRNEKNCPRDTLAFDIDLGLRAETVETLGREADIFRMFGKWERLLRERRNGKKYYKQRRRGRSVQTH